jgi:hypothetical protein
VRSFPARQLSRAFGSRITGIFGGPAQSYAKLLLSPSQKIVLLNDEAGAFQNAVCKGTQKMTSG